MTTSVTDESVVRSAPPAAVRPVVHRHVSNVPVKVVTAATAVASTVMYWAVHYNLVDDAYITLAYAKQLAYHGNWGMVPDFSANSATSPLNVLLIAAGTFVTRRPLLGLGIVYVASFTVLGWTLARTARALRFPMTSAVLAVALVLFNPWILSSTGLETVVYAGLLGAMLCTAVEGRPALFGVVAGLALLCRLDTVLFIVPFVLWTAALRARTRALQLTGIAAAVSGPWFVMRWIVADSAIPDTFVIKTLQHSFGTINFANAPFRFTEHTNEVTRWSFAPVLFGAIATLAWLLYTVIFDRRVDRRLFPVVALGIGGFVYYTTYSFLTVPPYHWYYCPVMIAAAIVLAFTVGDAVRRLRRVKSVRALATLLFLPVAFFVARQLIVVKDGGLPWRYAPLWHTNWAETDYYRVVARDLHALVGDQPVSAPGEIGALAFYCDCNVVDQFADYRYATPMIETRIDEAGPVMRFLLDLNYQNLDRDERPPPVAYHLIYEPGWVAGGAWNVWSSWRGYGHLRLVRA
jgi:hypothetical protein